MGSAKATGGCGIHNLTVSARIGITVVAVRPAVRNGRWDPGGSGVRPGPNAVGVAGFETTVSSWPSRRVAAETDVIRQLVAVNRRYRPGVVVVANHWSMRIATGQWRPTGTEAIVRRFLVGPVIVALWGAAVTLSTLSAPALAQCHVD